MLESSIAANTCFNEQFPLQVFTLLVVGGTQCNCLRVSQFIYFEVKLKGTKI